MKKTLALIAGILFLMVGVCQAADVSLEWNASDGATGYKIYKNLDNGVTWDTGVDAGAGTTFTYTNVEETGLVLFRVSASNIAGESIRYWSGVWYDHTSMPPNDPGGGGDRITMIRYYLIPFETDKEKLTCDTQPMYLDKLGSANGLIPKSLKMNGSVVTEWLREYYVVRVERKNVAEYKDIELLPLAIRLDVDTELTKLTTLGMDTSLVASRDDMDKVVTKWLIDEERILSKVLP